VGGRKGRRLTGHQEMRLRPDNSARNPERKKKPSTARPPVLWIEHADHRVCIARKKRYKPEGGQQSNLEAHGGQPSVGRGEKKRPTLEKKQNGGLHQSMG